MHDARALVRYLATKLGPGRSGLRGTRQMPSRPCFARIGVWIGRERSTLTRKTAQLPRTLELTDLAVDPPLGGMRLR